MKRLFATMSVVALLAGACTAGGGGSQTPQTINPSASHAPMTIEIWGQWTGREFKEFNQIFTGFEAKYPWITVKSVPGIGDPKALAAINSGTPPDVILSFGVDNIGKFCSSGAWIPLQSYIDGPDGIDLSAFPPQALAYTSFEGNQCSLPFMTDTFGFYYNKDMFAAKGIAEPPKTMSELADDAKKLTEFNPDGSIKVAGFVPWMAGYYCCAFNVLTMGHEFGATWYDAQGKSTFATDPAWAAGFQWQKDLVDFYGADNLAKFVAGSSDEFGSAQDFEIGRVAMAIDGEWRNAFIADATPNLNYGTAPYPVADDHPELYGSGLSGGSVIGIPRGAPHEAEAWLLVKYMTTDTPTLVYMANTVNNVPTTFDSLQSPDLTASDQFKVFLQIFENPDSIYKPPTVIGIQDQNILSDFADKWESGSTTDLQAGLQQAAQNVDNAIAQAGP
jgi:multiple sugar transport system substrate-binding protein